MAAVAAFLALGAAVAAQQKDWDGALPPDGGITAKTRAVLTKDYAYLFGRPELIAESDARILAVSQDSSQVLVSRTVLREPLTPPLTVAEPKAVPGELEIVLWDKRRRESTVVYREAFAEKGAAGVEKAAWLPSSRLALFVVDRIDPDASESRALLRLDTASAALAAHRLVDLGQWDSVEISPLQPMACIETAPFVTESLKPESTSQFVRVIRPGSQRMTPLPLPGGYRAYGWGQDGTSLVSDRTIAKNPAGKTRAVFENTVVDLNTGQVTHPAQLPPAAADPETTLAKALAALPIRLAVAPATVADPSHGERTVGALWLEPAALTPGAKHGEASVLLATDISRGQLLPDGSAALIQRDGALYAVPLYRISRQDFAASLRLSQRLAAISNAKQIGLATIGYALDYDSTLPRSDGDLHDLIGPYLKNADVFNNPATGQNGFAQIYQGTASLGQIASPATTAFGSVQGPGGRAVIYLDGHVTWSDDPAPQN